MYGDVNHLHHEIMGYELELWVLEFSLRNKHSIPQKHMQFHRF